MSGGYYVWEMGIRERSKPVRQVNVQPLTLKAAKDLARIGATEGKHDREVTTSPKSRAFRVVAHYEAGTGQNVTKALRANRLAPGKIRRRPRSAFPIEAPVAESPAEDAGPSEPAWRFDPMTGAPLAES